MKPNVLWIGVDQMRADTPGFMGNEICKTPNLDRLAAEGVAFDRAYAPSAQCTPSRASMLTGRYAFSHGMGNNSDMYHALSRELPHPEQLLTTRLSDRGYRLGYVGKWHVGTKLGPAEYGFEGMSLPGYGDPKTFEGFKSYLRENDLEYGPVRDPIYGNGDTTLLGGVWEGVTESTPESYLTERTCTLLDEFAESEQPFFLTCQYWAPHPPYLPSLEFAGMHDPESIPPWPNFEDDLAGKPSGLSRFRSDFYRTLPRSWSSWSKLVGLYYDYTAMVDAEIGRLLVYLEELELAEDTIVVFTSDHGDMNGSHGLFDKGFPYEEAHRVPLVMRWSGKWAPGRRSELVSNMDIMPTLLDVVDEADSGSNGQDKGLYGLDSDSDGPDSGLRGLDGRSVARLAAGHEDPGWRREFLLESHGMRHLYSQRTLVTDSGHKYIFNPSHFDEVYDLNVDPGELQNLLPELVDTDIVADLRQRLVASMQAAADPLIEYAAKLFGDWSNRSGQPDASKGFLGSGGE